MYIHTRLESTADQLINVRIFANNARSHVNCPRSGFHSPLLGIFTPLIHVYIFYMHNFDIEEKNKFFIFLQISSFPISHWSTLDLFTLSFETQFFPKKPLQNRFPPFPFYPFLFGSDEFAGVEGGEEGKVEVGRIRTYAGEIESPFRAVSRRLFRTILAGASSRRKKRGGHKWKKRRGAETRSGEDARVLPARTSAGDVCPRPADPSDVTSSISSREIPIVF